MTRLRRLSALLALLALSAPAHAGDAAFVTAELSTARETPDGETISEARKGDGYAVLKTQGEWVQVQFTDVPAWLPRVEVDVKSDVALKRVKSTECIVRSGPTRLSPVLGRLLNETWVVERGGTDGAEYREISFGGKKGYVPGACLQSERGAQPTSPAGEEPEGKTRTSEDGSAGSRPPGSSGSQPSNPSGSQRSGPSGGSGGSPSGGSGARPSGSSGGSPSGSSGSSPSSIPQQQQPVASSDAGASQATARASDGEPSFGRRVAPQDATPQDLEILARIVKGEALQCSHEGKVAVAAVVLNRVRAPGFPKTIRGVAHQPRQFSCYNPDVRLRLYYGDVPESCWAAAREALAGNDPSGGATYYFNPYLVQPSWARNMVRIKRIGTNRNDTHDFYRPR